MRTALWWPALAALIGVRLAIPLAALAASGHDLPGLPPYVYAPLNGDSFGYHAAAREAISAAGHVPTLVAIALTGSLIAVAVYLRRAWRTPRRWLGLLAAGGWLALTAVVVVHQMTPPGAPVVGWPLVWAIPLAPYRLAADPSLDVAFAIGLTLSLLAIAATVVATAYIGLYASGRRWVGLVAAALYAAWPFIARAAAGESAWENGQWHVAVGLHLYTEPLSTALVAAGLALLLRSPESLALSVTAGHLFGFATAVKLSNALIAAVLGAIVAGRAGWSAALAYVAAGACWLPLVAVYWPKGYDELYEGRTAPDEHAWALGNVADTWTDSLVYTPVLTVVLVTLAALGAVGLARPPTAFTLAAPILVTAGFYSVYSYTPQHPRFFNVILPPLLTLVAAAPLALARLPDRRRAVLRA